jgi:Spy/CpxP family protein refolding chaperone
MKGHEMKATRVYLAALLILGFTIMAFAQPGPGRGEGRRWDNDGPGFKQRGMDLPDLTDQQKEKIADLRMQNMKIMLQQRNQVQEKMAKLRTLETAEKADINAINGLIDEISEIKADMAKQQAAHRQQVRSLLTDEQKVIFDSRPGKGHHGAEKGHFGKRSRKGNCRCIN